MKLYVSYVIMILTCHILPCHEFGLQTMSDCNVNKLVTEFQINCSILGDLLKDTEGKISNAEAVAEYCIDKSALLKECMDEIFRTVTDCSDDELETFRESRMKELTDICDNNNEKAQAIFLQDGINCTAIDFSECAGFVKDTGANPCNQKTMYRKCLEKNAPVGCEGSVKSIMLDLIMSSSFYCPSMSAKVVSIQFLEVLTTIVTWLIGYHLLN